MLRGVDYFVSIHRNSTPDEKGPSGVESLVYDLSGVKYEMAQDINEQLEAVGFVKPGRAGKAQSCGAPADEDAGGAGGSGDLSIPVQIISCWMRICRDIAEAIAEGILDTLEYEGELGRRNCRKPCRAAPHYRVQAGAYRNRDLCPAADGRTDGV